jgi:II/X family phage/plasmid replication protein
VIDWLTLKVDAMDLGEEVVRRLRELSGRVVKLDAQGAIQWESVARENIRSDSHQVTVCMGGELTICGSPARVMGTSNVFGSGDIRECARAMLGFVARQVGVVFPPLERWRATRVDVTHNYDLGSLANVRQALLMLRHAEGGRYQLRTAAESVYWSVRSAVRSGKAYAKGPHLAYQRKQGACDCSDEEIAIANRFLRLELSLRSQYWREHAKKRWLEHSEGDLDELHASYFGALVGNVEVTEMSDVKARCIEAAIERGLSEGQGKAAFGYWCLIRAEGFERARELTSKSTHYRHVSVLRAAGFSWADFQAGRVVPLRRTPLVLARPVRSWEEARRYA